MVAVPRQFESIDMLLCPCRHITGRTPIGIRFKQPLSVSALAEPDWIPVPAHRRLSARPFNGRPNRLATGYRPVFSRQRESVASGSVFATSRRTLFRCHHPHSRTGYRRTSLRSRAPFLGSDAPLSHADSEQASAHSRQRRIQRAMRSMSCPCESMQIMSSLQVLQICAQDQQAAMQSW